MRITCAQLLFVSGFFFFAACNGDDAIRQPSKAESLPAQFRLTAEAEGTDNQGRTATCALNFIFELTSETARTET